jgi:hypothetical protein
MDEANVLKLTTIQTLSFNGWFYYHLTDGFIFINISWDILRKNAKGLGN